MLKPLITHDKRSVLTQPPSGGCVLKLKPVMDCLLYRLGQPPSGGCVLKPPTRAMQNHAQAQPPSGGCVLKLVFVAVAIAMLSAATFGWLCVETCRQPLD